MSALSEKEMEQLYGSLKKLGLLAAEKLDRQEARSRAAKNKSGNDQDVERTQIGLRTAPEGRKRKC